MVLYKCTKAAIVARTQRSQSLQDNKGTENLLVHPARRGPGMSIRGPWSRRPWRPARSCDDARRRLASESVPHTCRAESGRCLVRRNTASVARGWNLNSSESAADPGPCRVRVIAPAAGPGPKKRRPHRVMAAPARPAGRPCSPQQSGGRGAQSPPRRQTQEPSSPLAGSRQELASGERGAPGPRPDDSRYSRAAHWPAFGRMTPPAIGCIGPPPGRQSQAPSGPLAGSRQDDASGDQGAPGPRPDDSRKYRAAHWPAVGRMTPPAIRVRRAPARTAIVGTARPSGRRTVKQGPPATRGSPPPGLRTSVPPGHAPAVGQ